MARPRRTVNPRPQNMGQNRNAQMRNNSRAPQNRGTFQAGLSRNQGVAPQGVGRSPVQGGQQCPAGQEPGIDPNTGAQICKPARPNISSNVPVNNAQRAIAPGPAPGAGKPPKQGY